MSEKKGKGKKSKPPSHKDTLDSFCNKSVPIPTASDDEDDADVS